MDSTLTWSAGIILFSLIGINYKFSSPMNHIFVAIYLIVMVYIATQFPNFLNEKERDIVIDLTIFYICVFAFYPEILKFIK